MRVNRATTYCKACPRPRVLPANADAVRLFDLSSNQWRTMITARGSRAYALDYSAVDAVARWLGITIDEAMAMKIRILETELWGRVNAE